LKYGIKLYRNISLDEGDVLSEAKDRGSSMERGLRQLTARLAYNPKLTDRAKELR